MREKVKHLCFYPKPQTSGFDSMFYNSVLGWDKTLLMCQNKDDLFTSSFTLFSISLPWWWGDEEREREKNEKNWKFLPRHGKRQTGPGDQSSTKCCGVSRRRGYVLGTGPSHLAVTSCSFIAVVTPLEQEINKSYLISISPCEWGQEGEPWNGGEEWRRDRASWAPPD